MYELYTLAYGSFKRFKFVQNVNSIRKAKELANFFNVHQFYLRHILSGHIIEFHRIRSSFYQGSIIELRD